MKAFNLEAFLGGIIALAGYLIVLTGYLILGFQGILWLKDGHWTPFAMREIVSVFVGDAPIPYPTLSWQGIQKIAVWLLDAPLSIGLMVVGAVTVVAGLIIVHEHQES
jgi:hypothetical protein